MRDGVQHPGDPQAQLCKLLRELRKQAGLSIHQAGPDLDMSSSTLNRIEDGQGRTHPLVVRGALDLHEAPSWL
ncbi:helix-turn-helix domain-containing protein [Lentzea alba]|uniref:helix-turn-helix domain-containing protein n=1 Tax=Lentzea alba TaxID=2714351 RepID=UPI0039BEDA86